MRSGGTRRPSRLLTKPSASTPTSLVSTTTRAFPSIPSSGTRRPSRLLSRPSASTPTTLVPTTTRGTLLSNWESREKLNKHIREQNNSAISTRWDTSHYKASSHQEGSPVDINVCIGLNAHPSTV